MSKDKPTIVTTTWIIGDWMPSGRSEGKPPHRAPWQDIGETVVWIGMVWPDASHTAPLAVEDHDGCQALVLGEDVHP